MARFPLLSLLCVSCALAPFAAHATLGSAGNATVTKGAMNAQVRTAYTQDDDNPALDDRFRTRFAVDYGFTDDFALGMYVQTDDRGGDNMEFDAAILDARFELTEVKDYGFYSGIRFRYTYQDGDKKADNAHIRLILGKPVGDWDFRINQFFAYQIGEERQPGLGLETRLQTTYGIRPDLRVGVESFSTFGYGDQNTGFSEQSHAVGPVVLGHITKTLRYEAGYQYGISDAAADHTFKLFFTKVF